MMGAYWVNFAATGDPNGKGLPAWPAFRDRSSGRAMVLGDKVTVETAPDAARLGMYDTMYARLRAGN